MGSDEERRHELGTFLRTRREQRDRAAYGLPPAGRGRTVGLRREEVSVLSGVSVTWYTWLEQGRDIRPSRQVLDSIAQTLRMTPAEHEYVLTLSGFAADPVRSTPRVESAPAHVQRFLDAMDVHPAFALAPDWSLTGWNHAYEVLYPNVAETSAENRNLLGLIFTDPAVRELLDDWEITSRRFLAEFRAEAGPRLGDPQFLELVTRLKEASPEFRAGWERHDVRGFRSRERVFHHAQAGRLVFEQHQLRPSDQPETQVVVYTAVDPDMRERFHAVL